MADATDLFKDQKINKLQVGTIAAHINNLIQNDEDFEALFQSDPIGCLMQFGLSRETSTFMIIEAKMIRELFIKGEPTIYRTCLQKVKYLELPKSKIRIICEGLHCIATKPLTTFPDITTLDRTTLTNKITLDRKALPKKTVQFNDKGAFLDKLPSIDDTKTWTKLLLDK